MKTRDLIGAVCLVISLVPSLSFADFDAALEAYNRGDFEAAEKEFRTLSQQGYSRGHHGLGVLYDAGEGVPQDRVKAYAWFDVAAAAGGGGGELSRTYRDMVGRKISPAQVQQARKLARELLDKYGSR